VYFDDPQKGPMLAFHMWTEVFVRDQWVALDATLGRGVVGPAHLKVAEHGWNDTRSLAPLLPGLRVLGKIKVEVIEVKWPSFTFRAECAKRKRRSFLRILHIPVEPRRHLVQRVLDRFARGVAVRFVRQRYEADLAAVALDRLIHPLALNRKRPRIV